MLEITVQDKKRANKFNASGGIEKHAALENRYYTEMIFQAFHFLTAQN